MPPIELSRNHVVLLRSLGARLIDSRKVGSANQALARDLLGGFFDICMRQGLDRVLVELAQAFPPLDVTDRSALSDHPSIVSALVAKLDTIDIDDGGPRNAKPGQLADCVVAALGLTLRDDPDRTITLGNDVRVAVASALAAVIDVELAVPHVRETIIATARELCETGHHGAFDKIAAQLDERGLQLVKQPKVPLDAMQAVQRILFDVRAALFDRVARSAIDRATPVLARANAEAAARIDLPITLHLTPRDVAVMRVSDARASKVPAAFATSLFDSLTELSQLAWRPPELAVRTYAASQTFAVGDLIEHPKFGRGSVTACSGQRIDVEFADGKHTLVHARSS